MTQALPVPELIAQKRDGRALSNAQIAALIDAYAKGHLPEEQMSALAMAIYFRGLSDEETAAWTEAMLRSGEILDFHSLGRPGLPGEFPFAGSAAPPWRISLRWVGCASLANFKER